MMTTDTDTDVSHIIKLDPSSNHLPDGMSYPIQSTIDPMNLSVSSASSNSESDNFRPRLLSVLSSPLTTPHRKQRLERDVYTIMFVSPFFSIPFLYGSAYCALQISILTVAFIDLLKDSDKENILAVPLLTSNTVLVAQALALVVSVLTARDLINAFTVFQVKYDPAIMDVFPKASFYKWLFAHFLRFSVGIYSTIIVFIFIVQSTEVLDLFLDFTVVQFVSELDDLGFYLGEKGYSLLAVKQVAMDVNKIQFKEKETIKICGTKHRVLANLTQLCMFLSILCTLFGCWLYLVLRGKSGYFYNSVCQRFEVKFDNLHYDFFKLHCNDSSDSCPESWTGVKVPLRYSTFNDDYIAQRDEDGSVYLYNSRPVYHQRGKIGPNAFGEESPPGSIFYCQEENAWVFAVEGVNKGPADKQDDGCNWLMKSPETEAHALHEVETEGWVVWTGVLVTSDNFSISCIECGGDEYSLDFACTYHGTCVEEKCSCDEFWMGNQCETCAACGILSVSNTSISSDTNTVYFNRMDKDEQINGSSGNDPYSVYGRPVYYLTDINDGIDQRMIILVYSGDRYVCWDLTEDLTVDVSNDLGVLKEYLSSLHSQWDFRYGMKVYFYSEQTTSPTPFGLKWFLVYEGEEYYYNYEPTEIEVACIDDSADKICMYTI